MGTRLTQGEVQLGVEEVRERRQRLEGDGTLGLSGTSPSDSQDDITLVALQPSQGWSQESALSWR